MLGLMLVRVMAAAAAALPTAPTAMFGLTLVHNTPSEPGLISVDVGSGNVSIVGAGLAELAATGDLGAVDSKRNVYYFLGDSHTGAVLVGVSLLDGTQKCSVGRRPCRRSPRRPQRSPRPCHGPRLALSWHWHHWLQTSTARAAD